MPLRDYISAPAESTAQKPRQPRWGERVGGPLPKTTPEELERLRAEAAQFSKGFRPTPYSGGTPDEPLEAPDPLMDPTLLPLMLTGAPNPLTVGRGFVSKEILPLILTEGQRKVIGGAIQGGVNVGAFEAGADIARGENPLPGIPWNVGAGVVGGGALAAGGHYVVRPAWSRLRKLWRVDAEPMYKPRAAESGTSATAPTAAAESAPAPAAPPRQPFTGTNAQQDAAIYADIMDGIRSDPVFLEALEASGGGRVITNRETLAAAMQAGGPLALDEIAARKVGDPISTVEQVRALLTRHGIQRALLEAMSAGDSHAARGLQKMLLKIEPGMEAMLAEGPRATQAQAMFVENRVTKALADINDMMDKGVPFEQMAAEAKRLVNNVKAQEAFAVRTKRALDWIGALETYATAAKLTSHMTHAVNTVSNAGVFTVVRAGQRAISAAELARSGESEMSRAYLANLWGTSRGLRNGWERAVKVFKGELDDMGKAGEFEPVKGPVGIPFQFLSAADAFWKGILVDSEVSTRALASALKQKLTGKAKDEYVAKLMNDPPKQWLKEAEEVALEYTFQERGDRVLAAVQKLQNLPGMKVILPFTKTPYNLFRFQARRDPLLGLMSQRNWSDFFRGDPVRRADAIGRYGIGIGMSLGAWSLVQNGEVTGGFPKDNAERALWEAEGIKPYSVKVGDRWVNYGRLQPLGQYLNLAVAYDEALKNEDDAAAHERFGELLFASIEGLTEQPFLQSMSVLADVRRGDPYAVDRFMTGTVTGFIPTALGDIRAQTDPVQRESYGFGPAIANRIPGLSQMLPPKVDVEGREVRYDPNRLLRSTKMVSQDTSTPVTQAYRRSGYTPPRRDRVAKITVAGQDVALTHEEREQYEKEIGEAVSTAVRRLISGENFGQFDKERQAELIRKVSTNVRKDVTNRWRQKLRQSGRAGGRKQ